MDRRSGAGLGLVALLAAAAVGWILLRGEKAPPVPPQAPPEDPGPASPAPPRVPPPLPAPKPAPAPAPAEDAAARKARADALFAEQATRLKEKEAALQAAAEDRQAKIEKFLGGKMVACTYENTSFEDAVKDLATRTGVSMVIDEDLRETLRGFGVSFKFQQADSAKVVRTLSAISGAIAEVDGTGIRFRKPPPTEE